MTPFLWPFFTVLAIDIPWSPNIFTLGGFILTWHGLFTAIGILAGVQLSLYMGKKVRYDPDQAYTLALPFWGRTLAGDLAFTAGIFAIHALVSRKLTSAQTQTA